MKRGRGGARGNWREMVVVVVGGALQTIKSYNIFGLRYEGIQNHPNLVANLTLAFGSRHVNRLSWSHSTYSTRRCQQKEFSGRCHFLIKCQTNGRWTSPCRMN